MNEEKDMTFAEILTKAGITRQESKVILYLIHVSSATAHEIERGTDMRQPEVSIATSKLIERKWVLCVENHDRFKYTSNKGRPVKHYKSIITINEILTIIENNWLNEMDYRSNQIKKLRKKYREDEESSIR